MFESQITPCFQCFYCRETVVLGTLDCPYCESEIDQQRAAKAAAVYLVTTKAVQSAGIITNGDISVLLFLLYTFWLGLSIRNAFPEAPQAWLWIEGFFALFWSLPVIASLRWLHRFGKLITRDADYVTAKKDVRWSLRLWVAAHIFHLLLVIVDPWAAQ
jgi:hypothetical protein